MKKIRKYEVTFKYLSTGNTRTVTVQTSDSLTASRIVYENFKDIEVVSAKFIKD